MSRFDDLRQAAGISPVASSGNKTKAKTQGVNFSTREVTDSPIDTSLPGITTRPVRPTQMVSIPSLDVRQSPLLRGIRENPPSDTPIQDVVARGASKVANAPIIKPALQGLGKAIDYIENLPGIKQAGGAIAGAYNTVAEQPSVAPRDWMAQARKNIANLATSDTAPIEKGIQSIIQGAKNPEEARAKKNEIIASRTEGMGPVSKFGYEMLSQGATDPLSLIPAGGVGRVSKLASGSGDLLKATPKSSISALREIAAGKTAQTVDDVVEPISRPTKVDEVPASPVSKRSGVSKNFGSSMNVTKSNVQDARTELKNVDTQLNALEKDYQRAIDEQYQYLKSSSKENRGGEKGGLIKDPVTGEVVDRYGAISSKPIWYQEALKEFNVKNLNNTQLRELAKKHIDEGFNDDGGFVPSIRDAIGYDKNTVNSLKIVKQELEQSVKPLTLKSTPEEVVQAIQQPRVRDRVYNFLDEQEAAARARIKGRKNYLSANPIPEYGDYAIIGAAKLGKGTIKAADWTEEMVKEFGEGFRNHAPKIYQQSKELLRRQERIASKEGEAAASFNAGVGDAASFDKKINRQVNKRSKSWNELMEQARTQFIDRRAPLEGLEKRVKGEVGSAEKSLYKSSRLFAGVGEKANQIIKDRLTPIMNDLESSKLTPDDLGRYALAKHAKDVNEAGYKSGFTNAEIDDVIRKYENAPGMEQARLQLIKVNKDMLDELVNAGVTSSHLRDTLNERWENYIPLFRSFEDDPETFAQGLGQSLKSIGDPIQKLKGSERNVIDPLENMVKNIYQSVMAAERNKVKLQLSDLAKADTGQSYIRKLKEDEAVGKKNVVPVRENGETVRYEVEPSVYKAFAGLDDEAGNMLMRILAAPASVLRAGATLTPDFALRNPMRDVIQAFITSKSGFNPVVDFPIGMYQTITKGKYYKDWIDNLGAYGNTLSMDRNMHKEALEAVLKQPNSKKVVNILTGKSLIKLLRTITDATESATKVGEYRKAIMKGETPQEAAYRARDLMDFGRVGTSIKPANRIISFLNANIQGKSKLLRAIKEDPAGTMAKMFASVTVPTVAIYAFNYNMANDAQRQTIDEAPDWQKDAFWMVAVPGTDTVARIPKPFDVAPVFANLPDRILDSIYKDDPVNFGEWVQNTMKESALPSQISGLLPLIEGMSGYSFFRQGDIVPQREQGLEFKDQYDPVRTSEVAKLLAAGAGKVVGEDGAFKNFASPRIMDNTIKGFTAGLGTYATDAIDAILKGPNIPFTEKKLYNPFIDRPTPPEKRAEQQPFARSFLVDPLGATKSTDKMYSLLTQLTKEESSRQLRGEEPTMIGKKTIYLSPEKAQMLTMLQAVSKEVSDINKEIRAIESDKVKTAKQKRNELEPLLAKRNQLSSEVIKNQKR